MSNYSSSREKDAISTAVSINEVQQAPHIIVFTVAEQVRRLASVCPDLDFRTVKSDMLFVEELQVWMLTTSATHTVKSTQS